MRVGIDEAQNTLASIIQDRSSLTEEDSRILANSYVDGELQGSHSYCGIAAFPYVVDILPQATSSFTVLKETESFTYADAEGSFGAIVGLKLANMAIDKAREQGVAFTLIRNMKSWLRPGSIARHIAENHMVGLVTNTSGSAAVVPPGGKDPVVGTNPIGLGVPTTDSPRVIDMATSMRAWGEKRVAKKEGKALPHDSFIDDRGVPTLDPNQVHAALPMADYKGFGLSLFIQMMCGSLVNMSMMPLSTGGSYKDHLRGAAIVVINPDMTVGTEQFEQANTEFIAHIQSMPPAQEGDHVTVPGDRSNEARQHNISNGHLEVDDELWAQIKALQQI